MLVCCFFLSRFTFTVFPHLHLFQSNEIEQFSSSSICERMTTVKRRNVPAAASSNHDETDSSAHYRSDSSERRARKDDDERDSDDDKDTRLTLMEEVLLLGLKDREVRRRRGVSIDVLFFCFVRVTRRFGTIASHQVFAVAF